MRIGIIRDPQAWKRYGRKNNLSLIQNLDNQNFLDSVTALKDKTKAYKCLLFISNGNYPNEIKIAARKILQDSTVKFQSSCLGKEEEHVLDVFSVVGRNIEPNVFHIEFSELVKNVTSFPVDVKTEKQGENIVSTLRKTFPLNKKLEYCKIENGEFKDYTFVAKLANFFDGIKFIKNYYKQRIKNYFSFYNEMMELMTKEIEKEMIKDIKK